MHQGSKGEGNQHPAAEFIPEGARATSTMQLPAKLRQYCLESASSTGCALISASGRFMQDWAGHVGLGKAGKHYLRFETHNRKKQNLMQKFTQLEPVILHTLLPFWQTSVKFAKVNWQWDWATSGLD